MSRIQPALADGRCLTSWVASCAYDQTLASRYNATTDAEYRQYLQSNALRVQQDTRKLNVWTCAYPFLTPLETMKPVVMPSVTPTRR